MNISAQLRSWRGRLGLSQARAAAVLGVNKRTLENWEQGKNEPRGLALRTLLQIISEPAVQTSKPTKKRTKA